MGHYRMLIVDDKESVLRPLVVHFRNGYECHTATSGAKALELIKKTGFDIGLFDYNMPGMTGIQLYARIKDTLPDFPVILFTGAGDIEVATEALREGIKRYVEKPLDFEKLHLYVKSELELAELRKENRDLKEKIAKSAGKWETILELCRSMEARAGRILTAASKISTGIHLQDKRSIEGETGALKRDLAAIMETANTVISEYLKSR